MTHELIISLVDTYVIENEKFEKGNKLAGTRARRALAEIGKLVKIRRKQIQDLKNINK
jgi:hypothetical protein